MGAALLALLAFGTAAGVAGAAGPTVSGVGVKKVSTGGATFVATIDPKGKPTRYRVEYGREKCPASSCVKAPAKEGEVGAAEPSTAVEIPVTGLNSATAFHYRIIARSLEGETSSEDEIFATYAAPLVDLPEGRKYEQASPTDKDGGDAGGKEALVKAAADGNAVTFNSTFAIPGAEGAQALPTYQATRTDQAWTTEGLLPPETLGQNARVLGWTPNLSETYSTVTRLGAPRTKAFLARPSGGPPIQVAPYVFDPEYAYLGTSKDGQTVLFSANAKLPPKSGGTPIAAAIEGAPNLYAWSRQSGEVHLASVFNDETSPSRGSFAGAGIDSYFQDQHAFAKDGSVYFFSRGSGQLYRRVNPTEPQSPLTGDGSCEVQTLACTFHVSASEKVNGEGPGGTDSAGPQKAEFQAASADGSLAFFTSTEKLTDDANTGSEQPAAAIARSGLQGETPENDFLPAHALGVAVSPDGEHLYWADPANGAIARARLNGSGAISDIEDPYIEPGETEAEVNPSKEPGVETTAPTAPRYVAVDGEHVYWTNTGPEATNNLGDPVVTDGTGTVGRAKIGATEAEDIKPEWITGASNPQGIAINGSHVYWANAGNNPATEAIARAKIDGSGVQQSFFELTTSWVPSGVALDGTHVYFSFNEGSVNGYLGRIPLAGGVGDVLSIGIGGIHGIALSATNLYWAAQGEGAIGRMAIADFPTGATGCPSISSCETSFLVPEGALEGLATDSAHLYWSANGEAPTNPGNDLYRYSAQADTEGHHLSDLTPDSADEDGAEVKGVLGASADGSRVYFIANADLDGSGQAEEGDCGGPINDMTGSCSLYEWHEGQISFVAPVDAGADVLNWVRTPRNLFATNSYKPRSSRVSADGLTLLFSSHRQLSAYDNNGKPEFYRYREGEAQPIRCISCRPSGEAPGDGPDLGSIEFREVQPIAVYAVANRNLSADGNHVFFETAEALSPTDTNGLTDVYEWVAQGVAPCAEGTEAYSPLDRGCLYLLSGGQSTFPSLIADASLTGEDVLFFTRQRLVGQDEDELQDVYDARVGGRLPSQNPPPPSPPCESADACRGPEQPQGSQPGPATPVFHGPVNLKPKRRKAKQKGAHLHHKKGRASHRASSRAHANREAIR